MVALLKSGGVIETWIAQHQWLEALHTKAFGSIRTPPDQRAILMVLGPG
jgi:hypothetical protein